jgi:hypothetical protein
MQEPGSPGPGSRPPEGHAYRCLPLLLVGILALVQAGCLVVAAGLAGGAAATGYVYYRGRLCHDYLADLPNTVQAVRTALSEMKFEILSEESKNGTVYLGSRTADGSPIHIWVEPVFSRIPSEPTLTRVAIRVGFWGDESLSNRILDQVGHHLVPPMLLQPTPQPPPVPPPVQSASAAAPRETAAPPLAAPLPPPPQPPRTR